MLPLFNLEEYLFQHEHKAEVSLCSSGLDSLPLQELLALAKPDSLKQWETQRLGYSTPQGLPALRESIANHYPSLLAENIMIFSGACEAIYLGMQALLKPDDHVIAITPCYQSLKSVAASICEVTEVALQFEDNWQFHPESIQNAIRPNTKLIVVNFPNNPTGALPNLNSIQALIEIARKNGIRIFSDEVYRLMEFNPADRLPPIATLYEKGISVGSMSKAYGLPGLRIGWIATPEQTVISKLLSLRHYVTICPNTPSETLALIALQASDTLLARNLTHLKANFKVFEAFMAAHTEQFEWVRSKAGCLAYPRLLTGESAEAFSLNLLEKEKTLVLPGSLYDSPGSFIRFGFGSHRLPEALSRLSRYLG